MRDSKYDVDFPDSGTLNWKAVKIKNVDEYYNDSKIIGVLLHDGKFMVNGVIFEQNQFDIIDENPLEKYE